MTDLPRLTVTQEMMVSSSPVVTLRLPERPTMRCGPCGGDGCEYGCAKHGHPCKYAYAGPDSHRIHAMCDGTGVVSIPEGTRVEVGGWEDLGTGEPRVWHPVATATVDQIHDGIETCLVMLSDIQPANDYDDGQPV